MALLLTGSIGIASEGGEFSEIVKKCCFSVKPDDDTKFPIKRTWRYYGIGLMLVECWIDPRCNC